MSDTTAPAPTPKTPPKYQTLTANFLRGGFKGQLASIGRDPGNVERIREFSRAIKDGDVTIVSPISAQAAAKLKTLNIPLPAGIVVSSGRSAPASTATT